MGNKIERALFGVDAENLAYTGPYTSVLSSGLVVLKHVAMSTVMAKGVLRSLFS